MKHLRPTLGIAVLAIALAACPAEPSATPEVPVTPDTVGQIFDTDHDPATDRYTLDLGGSTVELGPDAVAIEGRPVNGGLLLVGEVDGQRWYAVLPARDDGEGCFALANGSAINEGSTILFPVEGDYGLRLEKAAEWTEPTAVAEGDRYPIEFRSWCVNAEGQITDVEQRAASQVAQRMVT